MPDRKRAVRVGRRTVQVSNAGKVLYPGDGITKGELVDYYRQVAGRMLPRRFARQVAAVLAARQPDRLTTEQSKQRRGSRLYLDVMRNAYAQTAVPPYAVRARPGATVATPLDWSEVEDPSLRPAAFTIRSVLPRFEQADPWKDLRRRRRSLARARRRLEGLAGDGG